MRLNEPWTCPDDGAARAQAPGCQHGSCGSVRRGRGGICIASDVVKVEGRRGGLGLMSTLWIPVLHFFIFETNFWFDLYQINYRYHALIKQYLMICNT